MKGQIIRRLKGAPVLYWSDILFTVLPFAIWGIEILSRPVVMNLRCGKEPTHCTSESIPYPDRLTLGMNSGKADELSFLTQDLSGYTALGGIALWNLTRIFSKQLTLRVALAYTAADWLLMLQSVAWNGMANETTRLIIQRPRPFVYADPATLGSNPAHYTSFYSGHTSFSAAAGAALILALLGRGAPLKVLLPTLLLTLTLTGMTGVFRIFSGRHFITDVVTAALAGATVSLLVAWYHRRRTSA